MSPSATVVIATHGRPDLLQQCVRAAIAASRPGDEIIVAASGSSASSVVAAPGVRWLACDDRRKDAKVNLAAGLARGEVIVLTDDDCVAPPGWVAGMAAAFTEPAVGVAFGPVTGLTQVPGSPPAAPLPPGPAPLENWRFAHGASMAVRRRALLDIGGFDERLGPGASAAGEEADLVVRLAAGGWQAAIADAPVMQHVDWRDPAEEAANQLVYERGAGVWLGAGLRRDFGRVLPLARLRLRYQRALYGDRQTRGAWFGPRTSLAFAAGLLEGGRMRPRRFVRADSDVDRPVRVMAIGSGPVLGDAVRREADADLVIVWDRSQVRSVTHRRFARWVAYAPRGTRRAAVRDYDGLITEGSPLPWTSALPVWSRDDAARVLETVAPGHRR